MTCLNLLCEWKTGVESDRFKRSMSNGDWLERNMVDERMKAKDNLERDDNCRVQWESTIGGGGGTMRGECSAMVVGVGGRWSTSKHWIKRPSKGAGHQYWRHGCCIDQLAVQLLLEHPFCSILPPIHFAHKFLNTKVVCVCVQECVFTVAWTH